MESMLERFEMVGTSFTWHNQLSKIIYARALLNTGKKKHAIDLYNQTELKAVPVSYKNYVKIRCNLIKAEILIFEKKSKEAKLLIEEVKTTSQMLKFKFFFDKAQLLESKILKE
jgi:outer membrane PBP1 activator LpoA protein